LSKLTSSTSRDQFFAKIILITSKKMFMRNYLFLAVMLSGSYLSGLAQTLSQTKTATFLNNLNQFKEVFGDQNYPRASAEDVEADDNIYTCSSKLIAIRDSAGSFRSNSVASLALQGFGFTIPDGATVENIAVRIRRFKNGRPSIGDLILSVMQRYQCLPGLPCRYGVHWTYLDDYPGKIYPDTETEYVFSQSGSGNNGGFDHNEAYQWTPAMVNQPTFGVRIDNYPPIGRGTVEVCYDLVEVTVEYSQTVTIAGRSPVATETKLLKELNIYPNPFTTKTNIQFTAVENENAVVELYNVSGTKVRTLLSGNVIHGQVYNVVVGDPKLPKGIYIYMISNGKQRNTGKLIKLE
jgi:hypothetical protein